MNNFVDVITQVLNARKGKIGISSVHELTRKEYELISNSLQGLYSEFTVAFKSDGNVLVTIPFVQHIKHPQAHEVN